MSLLLKSKYKSLLKLTIIFLIFFFLFKAVYIRWTQISQHHFEFDPSFLALSYFLFFLHATLLVYQWQLILMGMGERLGFLKSFSIHYLSQTGKYIPGSFWTILGKFYLTQKEGINNQKVMFSILYQNALLMVTGIAILPAALFFEKELLRIFRYQLLILAIAGAITTFYPNCLNRLLRNILRLFKKNYVPLVIPYKASFLLVPLFIFTWIVGGLAFFSFVSTFYDIPWRDLPASIGIFTIAGVIGLVPITPGSIGIREGIFSFLLSFTIPLPFAISISLLSRAWTMFGELFLIGVAYLCRRS